MKFYMPAITIFCTIISFSHLNAAKIYTWTDAKGNLHMSEEPPPENAKIKDVVDYTPEAVEGNETREGSSEQGQDSPWIERKQQEARDARKQAETAAREARAAQEKANQAVQKANEYISTHNRNQYMRRAYKYEMRKVADEAKAAQEQARVATEKALKADKRALAAEEEASQAAALPVD